MKTLVTEENINEVMESMAIDQKNEVYPGCEVVRFESGSITIYPKTDRAAIEFGGDSDWGDYHDGLITLDGTDEDGNPIIYYLKGIRQ
jgi:hypothetical protein